MGTTGVRVHPQAGHSQPPGMSRITTPSVAQRGWAPSSSGSCMAASLGCCDGAGRTRKEVRPAPSRDAREADSGQIVQQIASQIENDFR